MKTNMLILCILLTGCSSLKRTIATGAITGLAVGGLGGAVFSPDKESTDKNAYIFGLTGALAGAGLAYLLHEPKKEKEQPNMILDQEHLKTIEKAKDEVPLLDFSPDLAEIKPNLDFKPTGKYEVPLKDLPPELEGKVAKQYIYEYETAPKTIKIDNRTIEIAPFKAWEHVYEQQ